MEARSEEVPLYEKIKFLAIYSSNLDEFFRVRYANLKSFNLLNEEGLPEVQESLLTQIIDIVRKQQEEFGRIYTEIIIPELKKNKIRIWSGEKLSDTVRASLDHYFKCKVLAFLNPVEVTKDSNLFLENRALYHAVKTKDAEGNEKVFVVNIPSNKLDRFISLDSEKDEFIYMFLDDIIRLSLDFIFPDKEIKGVWSIKLNRDAELYIEDEYSGDLVEKITSNLNKRKIGAPSRFLFDKTMPKDVLKVLRKSQNLSKDEIVAGGKYHNYYDFFGFPNPIAPKLENEFWTPLPHLNLETESSMLNAIEKRDFLLHFPYESYDYVLRFFSEAANDPKVKEIRTTLYRIASKSFVAEALITAAKNGKKVIVFMELKARFDEENNIKWAKAMEEAGIKIIYSIPGLKVHAKVALIKREGKDGLKRIAYFGTGNFNEQTALIYADHALLTSNEKMVDELEQVLKYLHKKKKDPKPETLLISQFNMQQKFIELIDREIAHAKNNFKGHIIIKLNNLQDPVMIEKLYEASKAGVKIDLIIRGICCLVPELKDFSRNINVIRIVDRYLEHARIFWFRNKGNPEIFMGSADWMKRNLYFRIEVIFPILNEEHKNEIQRNLEIQLKDNFKAVKLDSELRNIEQAPPKRKRSAQKGFYTWLKSRNTYQEKNQ